MGRNESNQTNKTNFHWTPFYTHMIILLLIQYFSQRLLSRQNMHTFGRNIELRVKLPYVFKIILYGI